MIGVRRFLGIALVIIASYYGMTVQRILVLGVLILFVLFVLIPTVFHWCFTLQRHAVFLPWLKWPKNVNFDLPENEGLVGAKNFYLDTDPKVKVGVWHVLPKSLVEEGKDKDMEWYQKSMAGGKPIIVYMHGNTGSRARDHRIEVYKLLRELDYHVVAFDYRGYADSSSVTPTKHGVVTDGNAIMSYIREHSADSPIFVWGHSLGTAVSAAVVAQLSGEGRPPVALLLESPFNNIRDEIRVHPFSFLWRKMPWFDWFFTGSLEKSDVAFFTDEVVGQIHIPLLIMHAKDDAVVPFVLGKKLYEAARDSRKSGESKPVLFYPFEADLGYGHIYLYTVPKLPEIVKNFFEKSLSNQWNQDDFETATLSM